MLPNKNQFQDWIVKGRFDKIFDSLRAAAREREDKQLSDSILQLESRYNQMKKQEMLGTESGSTINIERNKITRALLEIIDELGEEGARPKSPPAPTAPPPPPLGSNSYVPLIVGSISLLLLLGIILFVPCPTSPQYIIFRIVLALGAAGVASVLPGFFKFGNTLITAGGALAVFALVYLIDPVKSVATDECGNNPFTQTVFLQSESGGSPRDIQGQLVLFLDNNQNDRPITERGEVVFNGVPGRFKSELVPVRFELEAKGYVLAHPDSTYVLNGGTLRIPVQRDSSLGRLRGYVLDAQNQAPLDSARLSSDGETFFTNKDGFFDHQMERIQEEYPVRIAKDGYETSNQRFYPGSPAEVRLKKLEGGK